MSPRGMVSFDAVAEAISNMAETATNYHTARPVHRSVKRGFMNLDLFEGCQRSCRFIPNIMDRSSEMDGKEIDE
ncbi:hypothetical protein D5086_019907 [Populus alba]|uniref:Uncharacterized protein n=1 Tax=Populus alba TaxID=43335 RepID=A0ACC4BK41_POPAL